MNLTPQDKEMFKAFHKSQLGLQLISYLERLIASECDARNLSERELEGVKKFARSLENNLIDRITLQNEERSEGKADSFK